ncbi:hypothetical protein ACERC8_05615 [Streptococcus sp. E29BA]|uniref:type II toxin-antitoxin system RelB/ParD family antitoxin n=1 Tax=Streptococcus sp. E29BA TaxID=3278716 RepID=UPI00359E4FC3
MGQVAEKTKIVNFRVEPSLVEEARAVVEGQGSSLGKVLKLFLKNIAVTGQVDLLSEEELERERLFRELQEEVQKNVADMSAGNYLTLDELEEQLFG